MTLRLRANTMIADWRRLLGWQIASPNECSSFSRDGEGSSAYRQKIAMSWRAIYLMSRSRAPSLLMMLRCAARCRSPRRLAGFAGELGGNDSTISARVIFSMMPARCHGPGNTRSRRRGANAAGRRPIHACSPLHRRAADAHDKQCVGAR